MVAGKEMLDESKQGSVNIVIEGEQLRICVLTCFKNIYQNVIL